MLISVTCRKTEESASDEVEKGRFTSFVRAVEDADRRIEGTKGPLVEMPESFAAELSDSHWSSSSSSPAR